MYCLIIELTEIENKVLSILFFSGFLNGKIMRLKYLVCFWFNV
ncbi:MAG: hypothetical protein ACFWTQ_06965 [Lactococcus sp.]|jgi:hypothetical protein